MIEAVGHLKDRIKYPSDQLAKAALRRWVAASALLALASFLKIPRPAEAGFFKELGIALADSPSDLSKKVQRLALPSIVGGGLLFGAASYLEWRNRIQFGNLNVSKVAVYDTYIPRLIFPEELANERFVGELHFQGKWKERFSEDKDAPIKVMRLAFRNLYALALAVENNDPDLSDFNYFVGVSSMVDEDIFKKFGFKVYFL